MGGKSQSTSEHAISIRVKIDKLDGWYIATSKDLPGFILADPDREAIIDDLPESIQILYSERHGVECRVVPSEYGNPSSEGKAPWLVMTENLIKDISAVAA